MSVEQLDLHILGQSTEEFEIEISDELNAVSLDLVLQSSRSIQIISRHLDQQLYDNDAFIDALKRLIRRSRYTSIQILVHDSTQAVQANHRLISLHQQLSSYVQIRQISKDYKDYNHAFLLADQTGYAFRQFADRFDTDVCYHNPLQGKKLSEKFMEIWEVSEPDPQLRRLHL
ncbi:MAG: hypothetical protein JXA04_08645 [Gammaproteobacteria bacterium]|nr:hypothetical protein [Gammaproteobacteria bacterium]